jgi:hypothetical protein
MTSDEEELIVVDASVLEFRDRTPINSARAHVPGAEELLLLQTELPGYYSLPRDALPDRNTYVSRVAQQLHKYSDYWTSCTVRLWFNNNRDAVLSPPRAEMSSGLAQPQVISRGAHAGADVQARDADRFIAWPVYARATTHVGFRVLMSNKDVAVSLVNAVVGAAVPSFQPIANFEAVDQLLPFGGREIRPDFHGKADGDRHVVIDIQARFEDYVRRDALLDAACVFARGDFRRRDGDSADAPGGSGPRKVYAIQIFNYDLRTLPPEVGPGPDFPAPGGVSLHRIRGIYLIRIELSRLRMTFPADREVTVVWSPLEWWLYLLSFSDRFTAGEIERFYGLGIPLGVPPGLQSLKRAAWTEEMHQEYWNELAALIPPVNTLATMRSDTQNAARVRGMLSELLALVRTGRSVGEDDVRDLPKRLPEALVKEIWEVNMNPREADEQFAPFLEALRVRGRTLI